tara:strand:- start:162 stop:410 length:249 start_codon:yes stop_codon:yes gene_type:complete
MEKTIKIDLIFEDEELNLFGEYAEVEITYEDGYVTGMTYKGKDIIHLLDLYSFDIFEAIYNNEINLPQLERNENDFSDLNTN